MLGRFGDGGNEEKGGRKKKDVGGILGVAKECQKVFGGKR